MFRKLFFVFTILIIYSNNTLLLSETLTIDDLVERNDLYYKKFTNIPFTGLLLYYNIYGVYTGKTTFKNGKKDGLSENYYMVVYSSEEDGTLWEKDHKYWKDGLRVKGNYKDGKKEGLWEHYYFYGELWVKSYYKDGKMEGVHEFYHENGQLGNKGNYKDGKKDGLWEYFNADGSLKKNETFRDGELVE